MIVATFALIVAQTTPAQACEAYTPTGALVGFTVAADGSPIPVSGSAWPAGSISLESSAGRAKDGQQWIIGDRKAGHLLRLNAVGDDRQLATLFTLRRGKPELPVAVGFCTSGPAPDLKGGRSSGANSISPDFWPGSACRLVSATGRTAEIDYSVRDKGGSSFVSAKGWPWPQKLVVPVTRQQDPRSGIGKFGTRSTANGTTHFFVAERQAAHLILFDQLDPKTSPAEPAAAICGYGGIVRRPNYQ